MGNIQKILFKTVVLSIFSNGSDPLSFKLVMIEQLMHKNQPEICLQYMNWHTINFRCFIYCAMYIPHVFWLTKQSPSGF